MVDVLCGRARLARLIVKHDPRPGDMVSITAFGPDSNGWREYGLNVDKSQRRELEEAERAVALDEEEVA